MSAIRIPLPDGNVLAVHFTTEQAPGAWPNGARVRKAHGDGSGHPIGSFGRILGSVALPGVYKGEAGVFAYFIQWDEGPPVPTFIANNAGRLQRAAEPS